MPTAVCNITSDSWVNFFKTFKVFHNFNKFFNGNCLMANGTSVCACMSETDCSTHMSFSHTWTRTRTVSMWMQANVSLCLSCREYYKSRTSPAADARSLSMWSWAALTTCRTTLTTSTKQSWESCVNNNLQQNKQTVDKLLVHESTCFKTSWDGN